ncbi:isoleucine--tRNA ligase [Candidatus Peregrinibacteria bacterium CG10_big_fil_rev_8_21_14_0_10_36_19]|nr:MAG: isoleucine--tRNA ligase [Candidatus Peregrinibacteria bacterium CG10_big_fil_rev_8_21_14_0_10_36_19]
MFKKVDPRQSFPEMEERMLDYWDKNKVFKKSVDSRAGSEKFVFFDGPPFANGLPHYGHILANCLKDAVTRYWTMQGMYVPRTNGWDCHGLPVEYEIEKELELSGRKAVVDFGVENFNNKCRESVFKYTKEWEQTLRRIGRWVDLEDSYATLDNNYMESIWWVFKQIWDKGMVYTGHKSMHVCPRCETPLSNFEVSQGYKDVTDLSAIVKFKLKDDALEAIDALDETIYVLAWTTTPWTLPGNVLLAFGPDIEYVKVAGKDMNDREETYIMAKALVEKVFGEGRYKILETVDQGKLVAKSYEPLFPYYVNTDVPGKKYVIALADFVTTEDGTGVVHIAPMFGEDDYKLGKDLGAAEIQHVHMDGTFTDDVKDFSGKFVKGQDGNVANWLNEKMLLFKKENYRHSYPHCWRCDTPLLNYSTRSLFIKVSEIKDRLLANNKSISWQPDHIQDGRFGKWLDGARDWSISRNRFWGCAIPVWECECGKQICIGSIDELKEYSGGDVPERGSELDLHKPYIDDVKFDCECGKQMSRIPDVFDCWFESGSMPYAQLHYPFENKEEFEKNFPANFIAEGLDQTRGWFYTLHVLSTILFDKPAFQNVIVNGILLAADGEKLSKRKKNYPDPNLLFSTLGADSTRMFLYNSTAPLANDVRFSEAHVEEVVKKFTLTLWNTYSFFVTYANIDKFVPRKDFASFKPSNQLDGWILSELNSLIEEVSVSMGEYNLTKATRPLVDFVDNLSNWYIRRSRRRFWKSENDGDKDQAYQTLYIVLVQFSKVLAPFMPFLADEIYQNLTEEESVHLADWPVVETSLIDAQLNKEIHMVRMIVNLGHAVRANAKIKVRQPLSRVDVALPKDVDADSVHAYLDVILDELNVKNLSFIKEASDIVECLVMPRSKVLGPKYGADVQKIIGMVKAGEFEVLASGQVKVGDFVLEADEVDIGFRGKEGFDAQSAEGVTVALDTVITEDLKKEGYARDIVRFVQDLRKEADYQVDDRILVQILASSTVDEAVVQFAEYIKAETLADELLQSGDFQWDKETEVEVSGESVKIAIKKN